MPETTRILEHCASTITSILLHQVPASAAARNTNTDVDDNVSTEAPQDEENVARSVEEPPAAAAAAAATEHGQYASTPELASRELQAQKDMIYSIVNGFLGNMTFNNPEAEELLLAALEDEPRMPHDMYQCVQEAFSPIFFHYPNGLKDRSVWAVEEEPGCCCWCCKTVAIRNAKYDMRTAKNLARLWHGDTLTSTTWTQPQDNLLRAYWNGSLHQRVENLSSQSSADPLCRLQCTNPTCRMRES